jgi:hypothetical protein
MNVMTVRYLSSDLKISKPKFITDYHNELRALWTEIKRSSLYKHDTVVLHESNGESKHGGHNKS